jgi:hypothetical protein
MTERLESWIFGSRLVCTERRFARVFGKDEVEIVAAVRLI